MIDEVFERWVDRLSESVPAYLKPLRIRLNNSFIGWRLYLYLGTAWSKIKAAFGHISNEENMDLFMRETVERSDDSIERIAGAVREKILMLTHLEMRAQTMQFTSLLFLMMLSMLGTAAVGGAMGLMTAAVGALWLSVAVENGYKPVAGKIRQRYLGALALRTLSFALLLIHFFFAYVSQGVPSNLVLQGSMIIMITAHVTPYLALVMLNTRQPLFLRALAGLCGMLPALSAASAISLAAACLFRPWPTPAAGVMGALGALLAFLGDELITIRNLGGIRLKYHSIWVCLLMTGGYTLMLLAAWTYAP